MRILNVSAQKPDSTGSGVFLAQMARCMIEAGHDVAVVCGVAPEDDPSSSLARETRVYPVRFETAELPFPVCGMSDVMPYRATRYRDLTPEMTERFEAAFIRAFEKAREEFNPDVVICHHLYLVCALARRVFSDRRVVAISHSTDLRQLEQHGLRREFIEDGVRSLDGILALHEEQAKHIERLFAVPRERISIIGTGFDAGMFNLGGRAPRTGMSNPPLKLLYVGKVCRAKGALSLLAAVDLLAARGIACDLAFAGGHSDEAEYSRVLKRAHSCAVDPRFLGQLRPEDLAGFYRASDVFVLPSFFEGLPLVIAEAIACGCAVAATDLPGIKSFYGRFLPDAPIAYARAPRMRDVDKPMPEDLPAFERDLADAIERAAAFPVRDCDASGLSWERLTNRALAVAAGDERSLP